MAQQPAVAVPPAPGESGQAAARVEGVAAAAGRSATESTPMAAGWQSAGHVRDRGRGWRWSGWWRAVRLGDGEGAALLASLFVVAACAILYELMLAAAASYLLGNTVAQYSITIGLFMTALGLGAYLSRRLDAELAATFVALELAVAVVGGLAVPALFWLYAGAPALFSPLLLGAILLVGTLVGLELPLVTRLLADRTELRVNLANVLAFDYVGGLVGSVAFPLLLLPQLGLVRTSLLVGLVNAGVALLTLLALRRRVTPRLRWPLGAGTLLVAAGLALAGLFSAPVSAYLEQRLYRDEIIYVEQTPYQRIVLTRWRDDLRLFLDGNLQFSSLDEHRYHEALVHPALALVPRRDAVLVLGGGDGLAVREILKWPDVRRVVLVDIDPRMVELARTLPDLRAQNGGALDDPRVEIVEEDAFTYLERDRGFYDVIVSDLPDPRDEAIQKLYSVEAYTLTARRLGADGVMAVQATSPYFAPEAFWSIRLTLAEVFPQTLPYHVNVPAFGDWGFVLASRAPLDSARIEVPVPTRYLTPGVLPALFQFGADEGPRTDVEPNRLFHPVLLDYYRRGWRGAR